MFCYSGGGSGIRRKIKIWLQPGFMLRNLLMKKFLFLSPVLILFVVQCLEYKYYAAAVFSFLASVAGVADLRSIGKAAAKNRGKVVAILVLMSLTLFYFRL